MKKYLLFILSGIILLACTNGGQKKQATPKIPVVVETINSRAENEVLKYSGSIIPFKTVSVSFLVSGQINELAVEEWDYVKKGQFLASLDPRDYNFALDAARAQYERARSEYGRLKALYEKNSLTQSEFDKITALYKEAGADLSYKEKQLNDTRLHSPCEGWVSFDKLETGETISKGIPAFRIIHSKNVYAKFMVPENEISKICEDQEIRVNIPSLRDSAFTGIIERISPDAEVFSRAFTVKAVIENEDFAIRPGIIADLEVPLKSIEEVIAIPAEAILKNAHGELFVFVVENDKARKKKIRLGATSGNRVIVNAGLSQGMKLVISGQQKLHENAGIKIVQGS